MKCGHCLTDFHAQSAFTEVIFSQTPRIPQADGKGASLAFYIYSYVCSKCSGAHLILSKGKPGITHSDVSQFYPRGGALPPPPAEVPTAIAADYAEANEVLKISPKASAALARRCLQGVLSAHGYSGRDLVRQIEAALKENDASKSLPSSIRDNIDAIRNFGNFSAHPVNDTTTLQIVDVEEGEAEWCLEILLDMFDHYYVSPAKAAERRAALASKLANAGKPPMKQ